MLWTNTGSTTRCEWRDVFPCRTKKSDIWRCSDHRDFGHHQESGLIGVLVFIASLLLLSRFSRADSVRPHRQQPTRHHRPWDSPGKNTGVGCHFLLQCMKVKSESEVSQLCPTLSNPLDCSPPGSSVHGIFQARVLEWAAIAFSVYSFTGSPFLSQESSPEGEAVENFPECDESQHIPC